MPVRFRILGLLSLGLAFAIPSTAAASIGSCNLYASPSGSDSANGSSAAPFKTVQHLADSLAAGQVGCLRAGAYGDPVAPGESFKQLKVTRSKISLTSAPGEEARINARLWIAQGANGVTIENLYLDGANAKNLPSPTVNAENAVFRHDEVTDDHTGICFDLGITGYGEAKGTLIEENRIHSCGALPSTNQHHGIYVAEAQNTVIRGNWIYDNVNRGIQLYPSAEGTVVTGNVIYGNGEGMIFSGNATSASSNSLVTHNVIAGSEIRRNVESSYEAGAPIGTNNIVKENCTFGAPTPYYAGPDDSGVQQPQVGFTSTGNVVAEPVFVDPEHGDLRLVAGNRCASVLTPPADGLLPGLTTAAQQGGSESPVGGGESPAGGGVPEKPVGGGGAPASAVPPSQSLVAAKRPVARHGSRHAKRGGCHARDRSARKCHDADERRAGYKRLARASTA